MALVSKAHPRDDLFPSFASSEAETVHKLINVVKANVGKKKKEEKSKCMKKVLVELRKLQWVNQL